MATMGFASADPAAQMGRRQGYGSPTDGRSMVQGSGAEAQGVDPQVLQQASRAMEQQDYGRALELTIPLADKGHVGACYLVGSCYAYGLGRRADVQAARRYFEVAASGEHLGALYELGSMYAQGMGVERNEARGLEYFAKAALLGDRSAVSDYGHMLLNGIGASPDFLEGIAWVMVAANRGDDMARGTVDYFNQDRQVPAADRERAKRRAEEIERSLPRGMDQRDDLVDYNRFVGSQPSTGRPPAGFDSRGGVTTDRGGERPHQGPNSLAGEWRGTASEEMDDGSHTSFPIQISLREDRGALTADVVCDMRAPMEDGRMADIRATGSFRGSARGNRAELSCPDAQMTLSGTGERVSLGPHQLVFEIQSGAMSGRIGTDFDGWTVFEARRTPSGGAGNLSGDRGAGWSGDEGFGQSGGGGWSGGGGGTSMGSREIRPEGERAVRGASAGAVTLESYELRDEGSGNAKSHSLLVPSGWRVQGGVRWDAQLFQKFVSLDLRVQGPGGSAFNVYPGGVYQWSNVYDLTAQSGFGGGMQRPSPGQTMGEGNTFMPLPDSTADYVIQVLVPRSFPRASGVRVVEVVEETAILEAKREEARMMYETVQRDNQMGMGNQTDLSQFADRVRIAYTEDGQAFEEDLYIVGLVYTSRIDTGMGDPTMVTVNWAVEDVRGMRTPTGSAGDRALLETVSFSLRPDPYWQAMILDLQAKINRGAMEGIMKRGQINREAMESAWNTHQETIRSQTESHDRMVHKFVNSIRDVDDYSLPDGSTVQLPSLYDHVYHDGSGRFVLSNDPLDSGGGWSEIRPANR